MHSTIYQISTEPIAENDYLNIDRIVAGENASISYVCENSEDGRKFDIRFLLNISCRKVCLRPPMKTPLPTMEASQYGGNPISTTSRLYLPNLPLQT